MKAKTSLIGGDEIKNTAHSYFDFNSPIVTNTTYNFLDTIIALSPNIISQKQMVLFPNPASTSVNFYLPNNAIARKVTIQNILMQQTVIMQNHDNTIDVSGMVSGFYFVKVEDTQTNVFIVKLIINNDKN